MTLAVFLLVLLAALLHAAWNAMLSVGKDRMGAMALISLGHWLPAAAALPFLGWVEPGAWPWLALSTALHVGYRLFLVKAYEAGDMSQVYPLARGSAPLLTAAVGIGLIGESLSPVALAGVAFTGLGIVVMSLKGGAALGRIGGAALGFAALTAVFICGYTLADGLGARASGNALAYAALLFVLDTPFTVAAARLMRGPGIWEGMRHYWLQGLAGGALSLLAYTIVIWAMTQAPIPAVAALRETSVLFGALIAAVILKERVTGPRLAAAALIVAGAALLRLG
jgi:drug/metabolite transporter (DMT)-like permease